MRSISWRPLHSLVHCGIIHSSQDLETIKVLINGWTGKEAVYESAMLFSYKKEGNPLVWCNMDGLWWHDAMWNVRLRITNTLWYHIWNLKTTKKRAQLGVGKMGEVVKRYKVWVMNKIKCNVQHGDYS